MSMIRVWSTLTPRPLRLIRVQRDPIQRPRTSLENPFAKKPFQASGLGLRAWKHPQRFQLGTREEGQRAVLPGSCASECLQPTLHL
jgi:hypothetical protein